MSIPTRTQISNYATRRGLKVEISELHHVSYLLGDVVEVKFDHTINFQVREAMAHALDTDGGVLYGSDLLVFYIRSLQELK